MTTLDILISAFAVALGGFLKGATGAGAPVVGVPILAIFFGVPHAVAIYSVLNLCSNTWQAWAYRKDWPSRRLVLGFSGGGAVGAVAGSILLASLPTDILVGLLATIVFLYIFVRVAVPSWRIGLARAERLGLPVGFVGGVMQGAGGISAPFSITFLNAMRLDRRAFIGTISAFFLMMSVFQVPTLIGLGVLDTQMLIFGILGLIPMFLAMPLGERAARHVSKETFDKLILVLLTVVAVRLAWTAFT